MKSNLVVVLGLMLAISVSANAEKISIFANAENAEKFSLLQKWEQPSSPTAHDVRVDLGSLDLTQVPEWESEAQVLEAFQLIRNTRMFDDPQISGFLRRITWLYPIDGCFTRAGLAAQKLNHDGYPDVGQVYVFGSLYLKQAGISWSYHVAPIVRVQNEVFVLDAAIHPQAPMKFQDWLKTFLIDNYSYKASVCAEGSWAPNIACDNRDFAAFDPDYNYDLTKWNNYWMPQERRYVRRFGDPDLILGDQPPWAFRLDIP